MKLYVAGSAETTLYLVPMMLIKLPTTQSAGEAYGKACNVLTDSAKTCAEPTATAYDHHESEVDVVKTVMLYIASWPKFDPVQVFQAVEQDDHEGLPQLLGR